MMKKIITMVVIVLTLTVMVGCASVKNNVTTDNSTTKTTLLANCYDKKQFKGNARIEQVFVTDVEYTGDDTYNVITLKDSTGNVWVCENLNLYLHDDVIVLITDNNTPTDVTDDCIVRFWVGIE